MAESVEEFAQVAPVLLCDCGGPVPRVGAAAGQPLSFLLVLLHDVLVGFRADADLALQRVELQLADAAYNLLHTLTAA